MSQDVLLLLNQGTVTPTPTPTPTPSTGLSSFAMTAREHIITALEDNRIIAVGEDPTAAEMKACLRRLNAMLKSWTAQGVTMWRQQGYDVEITAGTASVALETGISDLVDANLVVSATHERQMARWEHSDYQALPNKAQTGQPIVYTFSQASAGPVLTVWPVPSSNVTLRLDAGRITNTVQDESDVLDLPEMWHETVYSNLALRVAGMFGATLTEELIQRARRLELAMLDYDRPESYYLGSRDYRG